MLDRGQPPRPTGCCGALAATRGVAPHLHVPMQSGDDGVLRGDAPPLHARPVPAKLARVRGLVPGRQPDDGRDRRASRGGRRRPSRRRWPPCVAAGFSEVHVFPYSPRPDTRRRRQRPGAGGRQARALGRRLRRLSDRRARRTARPKLAAVERVLVEPRTGAGYAPTTRRSASTLPGGRSPGAGDRARVRCGDRYDVRVTLTDAIQTALRTAKAGDRTAHRTRLRLLCRALQKAEKDRPAGEFGDQDALAVLRRERKQRVEAAEAYRAAGHEDRAEAEEADLPVIDEFLPAALGDEELARWSTRRSPRPARVDAGHGQRDGRWWPQRCRRPRRRPRSLGRSSAPGSSRRLLRVARLKLSVGNELAAELGGDRDARAGRARRAVGRAAFLRGNELTLDGADDAVEQARRWSTSCRSWSTQGISRRPADRGRRAGVLDADGRAADVLHDVVWRHRGQQVAPKTLGQKRYVDAIRTNTRHLRHRPGRHRQDLPRDRAGGRRAVRARGRADHPHPPGGRGRRAAGLPARRPAGQGRPVPAPAVRRAARHARRRPAGRRTWTRAWSRSRRSRSCAAAR